jgi:hypothetical protein
MAKPYILINLNTSIDTTNWDIGQGLLNLLCDFDARLTPEFFSNKEEKINRQFISVDEAHDAWVAQATLKHKPHDYYKEIETEFPLNFCWKRGKVKKYEGVVSHTQMIGQGTYIVDVRKKPKLQFGRVKIQFSPARKDIEYFTLFKELCSLFKPEYAMLHLFTDPELGKTKFKSPENIFRLGPTSRNIQSGYLPNLAWANYFGSNINRLNAERLEEAGALVDNLGESLLFRLTENIFDIENDFQSFSSVRDSAKSKFDKDLFINPE